MKRKPEMVDFYDMTGASGGCFCPCPTRRDTYNGQPIIVMVYKEDCPIRSDFARFMRGVKSAQKESQ